VTVRAEWGETPAPGLAPGVGKESGMNPKTSVQQAAPEPPAGTRWSQGWRAVDAALHRWFLDLAEPGPIAAMRRRRMAGACLVAIGVAGLISGLVDGR